MNVIGRSPDRLSIRERFELSGKFMALEIYTPKTIPLRLIEAIGDSAAECVLQLKDRGLDPQQFEFVRITPPY